MSGKGRGVIRASATIARCSGPKAGEDLLLKTDQLIEGVHFLEDHASGNDRRASSGARA